MLYNTPYGTPPEVTWGDTPYVNGNPSTGLAGSIPPAASIEFPQREIVNLIRDANAFAPSNSDLHQLGRALQSGLIWYGLDTGSTNVMQMNLSPPPLAYYDGMLVGCRAANSNTAACALNINALGARPVCRADGSPTVPNDVPAGSQWLYRYDAVNSRWIILTGTGGVVGRPPLAAPMDIYVDVAIGSDTNFDGSQAAISGGKGPFQTIQHAFVVAWKYSPGPYGVTIHVAAGSYPNTISCPTYAGPSVTLNGAGVTSTFLTGQNNGNTVVCQGANTIIVQNCHVAFGTGVGPPCGLVAASGGLLIANAINGGGGQGNMYEAYGGYVYANGPHIQDASTSMSSMVAAVIGGQLYINPGMHFTFNGPLSVTAFATATSNSTIASDTQVNGPPIFVNPSYVTGYKFYCVLNGCCNVVGQSVNLFPGNTAGILGSGGQYG